MPRPRFEKLSREKQKAILAAAAAEFAAKGYSGASMNGIIEAAGISKGAMYYYFDDKEDLFHSVILDINEEVFDAIGEFPPVATIDGFWEASEDYFGRIMAFAGKDPILAGLVKSWNTAVAQGELTRPVRDSQKPHFDFHRTYIARGREVGAVRSDLPDDLLFGLLEAFDTAGDLWFARHFEEFGPGDLAGITKMFLGLYRRILTPAGGTMEAEG